jgi:hypothetical protein
MRGGVDLVDIEGANAFLIVPRKEFRVKINEGLRRDERG